MLVGNGYHPSADYHSPPTRCQLSISDRQTIWPAKQYVNPLTILDNAVFGDQATRCVVDSTTHTLDTATTVYSSCALLRGTKTNPFAHPFLPAGPIQIAYTGRSFVSAIARASTTVFEVFLLGITASELTRDLRIKLLKNALIVPTSLNSHLSYRNVRPD